MSTAVVRDTLPYTVTNAVRDRPGASYNVGLYVRARDTTPYLIFAEEEDTTVITGGGVDTEGRRRRNIRRQQIEQDDNILMMFVKEYVKH
jgi:hypothetical protein